MLFNSVAYLWFLPCVLLVYHLAGGFGQEKLRKLVLLVASYGFYAAWDARFLSLLVFSTFVDYACARGMEGASARRRRALMLTSLTANLGVLAAFKYFDFFVESLRALLHTAGLGALDSLALDLVLPLGISFYTFQTLAYTIDVYRRQLEPCRGLLDYSIFIAYFPQLVAGPIERARHLLPQLAVYRRPDRDAVASGLTLVLQGFFKKVAIGDAMVSPFVEQAFALPDQRSAAYLLLGACLFSIQIYVDFSGYTDIARGTSRLMGVELMVNFEQPYLSRSIAEFWRRWHISLSTWLRDYLYIPLGGNRSGALRTRRNLMLTMLLGGLWHGASWNFVLWGGLHGLLLVAHRVLTGHHRRDPAVRPRGADGWARAAAGCVLTNAFVIVAWVFFRAEDLPSALAYLRGLGGLVASPAAALGGLSVAFGYAVVVLALDAAPWWTRRQEVARLLPGWAETFVNTGMLLAVWIAWPDRSAPFIYFQF